MNRAQFIRCNAKARRISRHLSVAGTLVVLAGQAFGQSGPIPSYISSLSPYEVANLDGSLAPTNGNVSMQDVTPSEWLSNDPGNTGFKSVIIAWNGGGKGVGSQLFVHGGGHNDSANNGMYVYEFSGDSRPTGWQESMKISPVSAVRANNKTYSDGLPTAVHTYDGVIFADHNSYVYRFGGSQYNNGSMSRGAYKYNVSSRSWTRLPDYPASGGGAKTIYDADSGNIFVTMNGAFEGYFYRTSSDSWSSSKSYGGNGFPYNAMGVWDPTRNRGLIVGDGETSVLNLDFENETVSVSGFSPSGSTDIFSKSGISAVYDPVVDAYWFFGGNQNSPGWTKIYRMNADGPPWTVTSTALTGSQISRTQGMLGSWGRYAFMPRWRALGIVEKENGAAMVIRLPGEIGPSPEPPADMEAN